GVRGRTEDDMLHVFGRTNGKTRQYYYRRFEYGYWTAWERVDLNIEGDCVFPTIWRNQLYLFWVTTLEKPRAGGQDQAPGSFAGQTWVPRSPIDVEITFSWGEYYQGRWISPKSTNMRRPLILEGLHEFHPEGLLLTCRTEAPAGVSERLILWMIYYDKGDFKVFQITFTSKNSSPVVADNDLDPSLFTLIVDFYQQF